MGATNARKSGAASQLSVSRATVADIVDVLAKHNPGLSKSALETTGKAVAALSAAAARLSPEQQRQIVDHEKDLTKAMEDVVTGLTTTGASAEKLIPLRVHTPVQESKGAGLGKLLDHREGLRRLANYATPTRLEDWAGPVAGPGEIEKRYGTKRSTLHDWQKRGAIIGLLKGERKHVYPLAQLIDGRPVPGMSQITRMIGNPRVAWLWLTRPHPTGDGTAPLDRLKHGRVGEVVEAAERDFG
jgi:hypothetical protein